jgi:hypothetical protein
VAHVTLGSVPKRVVRMNPFAHPDLGENGRRTSPAGLTVDEFDQLAKLELDAVEDADLDLIQKLWQGWRDDARSNQPIRHGKGFRCEIGYPTFSAARMAWSFGPFGPVLSQGYRSLLNLQDAPEALVVVARIRTTLADPESEQALRTLLNGFKWRPHLVAAVALMLVDDAAPLLPDLYRAVWVTPQLLVVAAERDPDSR